MQEPGFLLADHLYGAISQADFALLASKLTQADKVARRAS
jgi:hypothetical protein